MEFGQILFVSVVAPLIAQVVGHAAPGLSPVLLGVGRWIHYVFIWVGRMVGLEACSKAERRIEAVQYYRSGFWHADLQSRNFSLVNALLYRVRCFQREHDRSLERADLDLGLEDLQLRGKEM